MPRGVSKFNEAEDKRLVELVVGVPVSFSKAAVIMTREFKRYITRDMLIGRYNRLKRTRNVPHLDENVGKRMIDVRKNEGYSG